MTEIIRARCSFAYLNVEMLKQVLAEPVASAA
jgi:hypothetical protein